MLLLLNEKRLKGKNLLTDTVDRTGLRQGDRLEAITELVLNSGSMRIEELSETFGVSAMTIHRDLDTLDLRGILRKSRGTATAVASSLFESSTEYRIRQAKSAKKAVARAAFDLVEPGQAVILDDSTTGIYLAELLPEKQPLTVITNFQRVAGLLTDDPGIALLVAGGQYYKWCEAYMGTVALNAIRSLRADIVFLSSPAVTDGVCYHQHHDAALIKEAMFSSAARRVLYLDHTKFSMRALHAHKRVEDFDTVIVDGGTPEHVLDELGNMNIELIVEALDN
jgi:DeoR/GlpR family transcriptional regulator of sugar metabolism